MYHGLVENLDRSVRTSPLLSVFFASQVKANDKGFLSNDITIGNLISHRGDIHHIFPKEYLRQKYTSRGDYNQIANFVYAQSEINIRIGKKAPKEYFAGVIDQCNGGQLKYGSIDSMEELKNNLKSNCIPESIFEMTIDDYEDFLKQRRKLMAQKIEQYYKSL